MSFKHRFPKVGFFRLKYFLLKYFMAKQAKKLNWESQVLLLRSRFVFGVYELKLLPLTCFLKLPVKQIWGIDFDCQTHRRGVNIIASKCGKNVFHFIVDWREGSLWDSNTNNWYVFLVSVISKVLPLLKVQLVHHWFITNCMKA